MRKVEFYRRHYADNNKEETRTVLNHGQQQENKTRDDRNDGNGMKRRPCSELIEDI